jgi:hypothetical protein
MRFEQRQEELHQQLEKTMQEKKEVLKLLDAEHESHVLAQQQLDEQIEQMKRFT